MCPLAAWLPEMRKLEGCADIPVVVLAGKGEESRLQPLQEWIQDRLLKPLEAQDTRQRIRLLLQLSSARGEA